MGSSDRRRRRRGVTEAIGAVVLAAVVAAGALGHGSSSSVSALGEPTAPVSAIDSTALAPAVRLDPPDPPPSVGYPAVEWPGPGQVALTFDDGPRAGVTGRIIDILDAGQAGGTFFVVGTMATTWPQLVVRAAESGHSIQNHTWNHPWLSRSTSSRVTSELLELSDYIESLIGIRPTVFRPPYGATNERVAQIGASLGMSQALWNAGPSSMTASAASIIGTVTSQARAAKASGNGLVVLFHDGSGSTSELIRALPVVIDRLRAAGWEFVVMA